MSNMKSKLTASVRQAKPAPVQKPPAKAPPAPLAPTTVAGEPQASSSTLFPSRVWPD